VTIVKMNADTGRPQCLPDRTRSAGRKYQGSRRIQLEKLSFVREDAQNCWADLAPVRLGGTLVPR